MNDGWLTIHSAGLLFFEISSGHVTQLAVNLLRNEEDCAWRFVHRESEFPRNIKKCLCLAHIGLWSDKVPFSKSDSQQNKMTYFNIQHMEDPKTTIKRPWSQMDLSNLSQLSQLQ